jgi:3-oxoacyl-[acyl-carrier protein] reductase
MSLRFAGKHCAVVGATGIIGSHIARAFAQQGAVVSILGRTALQAKPRLQAELTPYKPLHEIPGVPSEHQFLPLDVSKPDSIQAVFDPKVRQPFSLSLSLFQAICLF